MISPSLKLRSDQMRLVFNGVTIPEGTQLMDAGIHHQETVFVVLRIITSQAILSTHTSEDLSLSAHSTTQTEAVWSEDARKASAYAAEGQSHLQVLLSNNDKPTSYIHQIRELDQPDRVPLRFGCFTQANTNDSDRRVFQEQTRYDIRGNPKNGRPSSLFMTSVAFAVSLLLRHEQPPATTATPS